MCWFYKGLVMMCYSGAHMYRESPNDQTKADKNRAGCGESGMPAGKTKKQRVRNKNRQRANKDVGVGVRVGCILHSQLQRNT